MFGWGYAKDTCISLFQKEQEEKATKFYYAEGLRIVTENTAQIARWVSGGQAEVSYLTVKLQDILNPKPVDNRTADDIIEGIRKKCKQSR